MSCPNTEDMKTATEYVPVARMNTQLKPEVGLVYSKVRFKAEYRKYGKVAKFRSHQN
jgi:hypothetical protein